MTERTWPAVWVLRDGEEPDIFIGGHTKYTARVEKDRVVYLTDDKIVGIIDKARGRTPPRVDDRYHRYAVIVEPDKHTYWVDDEVVRVVDPRKPNDD